MSHKHKKPQPPIMPAVKPRPQLQIPDLQNLIAGARMVLGQLPTAQSGALLNSIANVEAVIAAQSPAPAAPSTEKPADQTAAPAT